MTHDSRRNDGAEETALDLAHACKKLLERGSTTAYIDMAEQLLRKDPTDTATAKHLASLYLERLEPVRALEKLAVCYRPDDAETLELIGEAIRALGIPRLEDVSVPVDLGDLDRIDNRGGGADAAQLLAEADVYEAVGLPASAFHALVRILEAEGRHADVCARLRRLWTTGRRAPATTSAPAPAPSESETDATRVWMPVARSSGDRGLDTRPYPIFRRLRKEELDRTERIATPPAWLET